MNKEKVFLWGTGKIAEEVLAECDVDTVCEVLGFIDSNKEKQGSCFHGREVFSPEILISSQWDRIIIMVSQEYEDDIRQQILYTLKTADVSMENYTYFYRQHISDWYKNIGEDVSVGYTDYLTYLEYKMIHNEPGIYKDIERYKKIQIFWLWTSRVGELVFMCEDILRDLPEYEENSVLPVFIPELLGYESTNKRILKGYAKEINIVYEENVSWWKMIFIKYRDKIDDSDMMRYLSKSRIERGKRQQFQYIVNCHDTRIKLGVQDIIEAENKIEKMNLNSEYVCFAGRDQAYLTKQHPGRDWSYHSFRNCKLQDMRDAVNYCNSMGMKCVLMGQLYEKDNQLQNIDFVNYSEKYQEDLLDWYLMYNCKFYFGDCGGVSMIAEISGTPCLRINFIPAPAVTCADMYKEEDLCICKKLYSRTLKRFLSFEEMWELEWMQSDCLTTSFYEKNQLDIVDNSPKEILDAVKEMNERLDGTYTETEQTKANQDRYYDRLKKWCQKRNLEYDKINKIRICAKFLEDNGFLLA